MEVERDELTAGVPKYLWHKIGGVGSCSLQVTVRQSDRIFLLGLTAHLGVNPTELPLVVINKLHSPGLQITKGGRLGERGHLKPVGVTQMKRRRGQSVISLLAL